VNLSLDRITEHPKDKTRNKFKRSKFKKTSGVRLAALSALQEIGNQNDN